MKVFIILAGLLMLGACTGKPEGFVLKGELKGAPDDHWVFLTNTGQTHYYDSTRLKNGRFEFKGKVDSPELRCITYFKDPSQRVFGWDKILNIPVFIENAVIQVTLPFAEMPSKLQKELPVIRCQTDGYFTTLLVKDDLSAIQRLIREKEPVFFSDVTLTLEEIFMIQMEEHGYDIRKILL